MIGGNRGQRIGQRGEFRAGMMACLPTLLGYWMIGFACGAIGRVSGFSTLKILALAIFVYAGSAHFLFYQLALTGAGVGAIALAVAFINLRYLLINAYMAQFFSGFTWGQKLISGLLITDETFGVAANKAKRSASTLSFDWLLGLNLLAWWNWIFANFIGTVFASALPDWLHDSLSFSLVGMFLGLLILTFTASHTKMIDMVTILIAIGIMLISQYFMQANPAIILASLTAAICGTILLKLIKNQRMKNCNKGKPVLE